jgi:FixJ family two-component response regulator
LPVILCTGFGNAVVGRQVCQTGVKAHLMKPFVLRDLAKTIRLVLGGSIESDAYTPMSHK